MAYRPIGLFDSGVGGLSVFSQLQRQLPREDLIYFADTLHMPYGPRSPKQLREFVFAILRFLQQHEVKLVIMACNTSSAVVLDEAQVEFSLPIIGMIKPVAHMLANKQVARLGVMATRATVESGTYQKELRKAGFVGELYCQACPELATVVEIGSGADRLATVLKEYTAPLRRARVEQVLLGCTHYPFVGQAISDALGGGVMLLDPATYVVAEVKQFLADRGMLRTEVTGDQHVAYVSGDAKSFAHRAGQLLRQQVRVLPVTFAAEQSSYHEIS